MSSACGSSPCARQVMILSDFFSFMSGHPNLQTIGAKSQSSEPYRLYERPERVHRCCCRMSRTMSEAGERCGERQTKHIITAPLKLCPTKGRNRHGASRVEAGRFGLQTLAAPWPYSSAQNPIKGFTGLSRLGHPEVAALGGSGTAILDSRVKPGEDRSIKRLCRFALARATMRIDYLAARGSTDHVICPRLAARRAFAGSRPRGQ